MRQRNSLNAAVSSVPAPSSVTVPPYAERHFSVAQIAATWSLSQDATRKIFQDEPGVLVLGDEGSRQRRRYRTLRIPESVLQRVHRRLSRV